MAAILVASRIDQLFLYALAGAVAGLILFFRGFVVLQRKRLILNTPTSKIRSASLGLVEVSGLATGPYLIQAPVTRKSCYYYRTIAWELRQSGRRQSWHKVADESLHVPFYLDDATGLLLVNPQRAETDLHCDFREEYANSFFSSEGEMPQNVRTFALRHGITGDHKVRIEEYCIKPKNALFVLGTLAENPGVEVGPMPVRTQLASMASVEVRLADRLQPVRLAVEPTPGTMLPTLTVHTETEQEVIHLSAEQPGLRTADMTQQGKIAAALLKAGISSPAAWSAAGILDPSAAVAIATGHQPAGSSAVAGGIDSFSPALQEFDTHPKAVLMKGENNSSFYISWRSRREVAGTLGWKSAAYIWGGPALTLISVYILLARL